jgi:hypothetical protein
VETEGYTEIMLRAPVPLPNACSNLAENIEICGGAACLRATVCPTLTRSYISCFKCCNGAADIDSLTCSVDNPDNSAGASAT